MHFKFEHKKADFTASSHRIFHESNFLQTKPKAQLNFLFSDKDPTARSRIELLIRFANFRLLIKSMRVNKLLSKNYSNDEQSEKGQI